MPDIQEVTVDDLKHLVSEKAITGENMLLNMGPQHPSTHGVLRLLLELDGETVINCIPDIGFLHTGVEKDMEAKTYQKAEVMSDRPLPGGPYRAPLPKRHRPHIPGRKGS